MQCGWGGWAKQWPFCNCRNGNSLLVMERSLSLSPQIKQLLLALAAFRTTKEVTCLNFCVIAGRSWLLVFWDVCKGYVDLRLRSSSHWRHQKRLLSWIYSLYYVAWWLLNFTFSSYLWLIILSKLENRNGFEVWFESFQEIMSDIEKSDRIRRWKV